ncbi:MAG: phosphoglycerate kinase [Patescibacteria group bacterium]|nr:phosphoglycerate kinase [Patescibacteria group bacterium]MDE2116735.1 phosphoglycerate kinase [Patescibacteria group bacterium]
MQIPFKKISDAGDIRGKKILLRLDLNVPIVDGKVRDDFKIERSLPTIAMLRDRGARTIIISHIDSEISDSLEPVAAYIGKMIQVKEFVRSLDDAPRAAAALKDGEMIILENIRRDPGEKANDQAFAGRLAALADYYVNDAFAVSHREHASIVSVPRLIPSFAGPLLAEEIEELSKAFNPPKPFLFILGGAKFDTKLPLIERFLGIADHVFVGGALANDIFKDRGLEVGLSVVSAKHVDLRRVENSPKLLVPDDIIASNPLSAIAKAPGLVGPDDRIMDAGPRTIDALAVLAKKAAFILWNGPLGDYEKGFSAGTEGVARAIAASDARSVVGGGDTIAVIAKLGILDKFSFVSTGGGAMIEFLAKGTLPGIEALKRAA